MMRLVSIEPAPAARVFALTYAVCGLVAFLQFEISSLPVFVLPIGIIMGVFQFNFFYFHFPRSHDLIANAFLFLGAIFSYGLSGGITGAAFAFWFNFLVPRTGGIDAKFVSIADEHSTNVA